MPIKNPINPLVSNAQQAAAVAVATPNPLHKVPDNGEQVHIGVATFRLPDGEHVMIVRTSGNVAEARDHVERIVAQNPAVDFDFDNDFMYVNDGGEADRIVAEFKAARQKAADDAGADVNAADEAGMDTPQRVLTNPEVVKGSKAEFDKMKEEGLIEEDAVYSPPTNSIVGLDFLNKRAARMNPSAFAHWRYVQKIRKEKGALAAATETATPKLPNAVQGSTPNAAIAQAPAAQGTATNPPPGAGKPGTFGQVADKNAAAEQK